MSILLLAFALKRVRTIFRIYTGLTAIVCLMAFGLFVLEIYLGLGKGGMERLASYPFAIWMALFGVYMTAVKFLVLLDG